MRTPALIGVITRSWASRGFCGATDGPPPSADTASRATPPPAVATDHERNDAAARAGKRAPPLLRRTFGTAPVSGVSAGSGPVPVPGTSLLPHGPMVSHAPSALTTLSLAGRGRGPLEEVGGSSSGLGRSRIDGEPVQSRAERNPCDNPRGACSGADAEAVGGLSACVSLQQVAAEEAVCDNDAALPGLLDGQSGEECCVEAVAVPVGETQYLETRSSQLAQYVAVGGWRGSAVAGVAQQPARVHGAGVGQWEASAAPVERPQPDAGVRLVLQGQAPAGGPGGAGTAAAGGCVGAWRPVAGQMHGAPRAGQSPAHAREEVCMWREDVEDRAGRVAAEAARAVLAPDAGELVAVGPAATQYQRDGNSGAAPRDAGPAGAGRGGRGRVCARFVRGRDAAGRHGYRRGHHGREDGLCGRLGYGEEEEELSPDGRWTVGSGSPEMRRADAAAGDGAPELEEEAAWSAAEGVVAERACGVEAGESLLLTGTACAKSRRAQRTAQRGRVRRGAVACAASVRESRLRQGAKHTGGTAAVKDCHDAYKAQPAGAASPRRSGGRGKPASRTDAGALTLLACASAS